MGQYVAPLRDMQFLLHEMFNVSEELKAIPKFEDVDADIINQVLEEGAKFTQEVLFPLNHSGDREGCHYDAATKSVTTPKGFKDAYKQYVDGGWAALACDPEYGGQGLPVVLNNSFYEMLNSSNQAWSMYPGLSHGAYECLKEHGTDEQKKLYLPKLVSGEWTGTMCLTEAHCGTDLGMLRSKALPQDDGSWLITGSKIFISAGEHDMSENIIHLVLARVPGAPEGSKGISLFVVPKFLPNEDGTRRRPQRHRLRRHRRKNGHPRQLDLPDEPGFGQGLDHRRAEQGLECHVRLHERRPPGRGHAVAGPDRSGLPERPGLRQGPPADAQPVRPESPGQASRSRSSCTLTCAACC